MAVKIFSYCIGAFKVRSQEAVVEIGINAEFKFSGTFYIRRDPAGSRRKQIIEIALKNYLIICRIDKNGFQFIV
jgi:hypothetical protein